MLRRLTTPATLQEPTHILTSNGWEMRLTVTVKRRTVSGMSAETSESFRERKKARTRQDLAAAAMRLFAEHGYEQVTVDLIAEAAWVSPRTFFRYFPSKEDVLWGDSDVARDALHAAILQRPQGESPLDAIAEATAGLAERFDVDPEPVLLRARIVAQTPGLQARDLLEYAKWEQTVEDALAQRLGKDPGEDLTPALIAVAAGGALRVAFRRWVDDDGRGDLKALIADAVASLRAAVCQTDAAGLAGT